MILAIDPSMSNTAAVYGDAFDYAIETFKSKNIGPSAAQRMQRIDGLVGRIMDWIDERGNAPDAIFIEGYAFGSNDANAKFSAEYKGLLLWHLCELTPRIFEVAPMTLKKFATGKGGGKKEFVIAHMMRKYGVEFKSNDEFDAFALYQLGMVCEGLIEADNQAQLQCADTVAGVASRGAKRTTPRKKNDSAAARRLF